MKTAHLPAVIPWSSLAEQGAWGQRALLPASLPGLGEEQQP